MLSTFKKFSKLSNTQKSKIKFILYTDFDTYNQGWEFFALKTHNYANAFMFKKIGKKWIKTQNMSNFYDIFGNMYLKYN